MRRQRRIRKEDIGDPSNFVHVQHVGFGQKPSAIPTQKSLDLGTDQESSRATEESTSASESGNNDEMYGQVERRNKGQRSSMIPRHHRSTTTCIFPPEGSLTRRNNSTTENHRESIDHAVSPESKSSLKPTFGSLLNLSFLPLGLGKSSSKSPSINKTKRMSLLNLTAGNLFTNQKAPHEENRESVHMTGYTRRRSLSNSNDENDDNRTLPPVKPPRSGDNANSQLKTQDSKTSTRIPLAKLGRSKSTMAEFTKRPKLRLKLPPPVPPPKPPAAAMVVKHSIEVEALPSPPPSPIPSPPPSPVPATPTFAEDVALRSPKYIPRPRVIPLPSTSSVDSADPGSPYLTPAGGCSPLPNESPLPSLLSPTIPPASTPFFPQTRTANPSTPPVWPLQPSWPTSISMQCKEATIPEVPSPCKEEEMEVSEEYDPVLSIVESFISCESSFGPDSVKNYDDLQQSINGNTLQNQQRLAVTSSNINSISSVLRENIEYTQWPRIAEKLFQSIDKAPSGGHDVSGLMSCPTTPGSDTYGCLLTKTLELWMEKTGDHAVVEKLVTILDQENHHQATESLQDALRDMQM